MYPSILDIFVRVVINLNMLLLVIINPCDHSTVHYTFVYLIHK